MGLEFEQHLLRQIAFSRATFGPGPRTSGIVDHIRKELVEVETAPTAASRRAEWVDIVLLGLDGLWRELDYNDGKDGGPVGGEFIAGQVVGAITRKLTANELRTWPDWRTADPNKAIEHDRSAEKE